jgi:predicted DNA-binding protein
MKKDNVIRINITKEQKSKFKILCNKHNYTMSFYLRSMIIKAIEDGKLQKLF